MTRPLLFFGAYGLAITLALFATSIGFGPETAGFMGVVAVSPLLFLRYFGDLRNDTIIPDYSKPGRLHQTTGPTRRDEKPHSSAVLVLVPLLVAVAVVWFGLPTGGDDVYSVAPSAPSREVSIASTAPRQLSSTNSAQPVSRPVVETRIVQEGDSLWTICISSTRWSSKPNECVAAMLVLNDIEPGRPLALGETLRLPN